MPDSDNKVESIAELAKYQSQAVEPGMPSPERADFPGLSPTRFGDWEKNGRCIDF